VRTRFPVDGRAIDRALLGALAVLPDAVIADVAGCLAVLDATSLYATCRCAHNAAREFLRRLPPTYVHRTQHPGGGVTIEDERHIPR
jgi:hypothetical protein